MQQETIPRIVAWVSRHPPLPAQVKVLADVLGDIKLVQVTDTYQNYRNVIDRVKWLQATHAVLVLPLSMIALILDSREAQGITWLRAEMDSAHAGNCIDSYKEIANDRHNSVVQVQHQCSKFNPDTDVLMPGENTRHLRFREFQVLKSVDLVTEPFIRDTKKEVHCGDWIYTEDGKDRRICVLPLKHEGQHTDTIRYWD